MQHCCWTTLHQKANGYANINNDQSNRSISTRQVIHHRQKCGFYFSYNFFDAKWIPHFFFKLKLFYHFLFPFENTNREREINNLVRRADFNNDAYVQEFGLTISNSMMEVRGRVLPPPKLQYGGRVSSISGQVSIHMHLKITNLLLISFKFVWNVYQNRWEVAMTWYGSICFCSCRFSVFFPPIWMRYAVSLCVYS